MAGSLPDDRELAGMSPAELDRLAVGLKTDREREGLSTRLLAIHDKLGRAAGAYSEAAGTRRNVRIRGHEVRFSELEHCDWIAVAISDSAVRQMVERAIAAGLTEAQRQVWILSEAGLSQREIAGKLATSQNTISRRLAAAKEALRAWISADVRWIFYVESHRGQRRGPRVARL